MGSAKNTRAKIDAGTAIRFTDLDTYLTSIATARRVKGSHHVYTLPSGTPISIPRAKNNTVKVPYIRALSKRLKEEGI